MPKYGFRRHAGHFYAGTWGAAHPFSAKMKLLLRAVYVGGKGKVVDSTYGIRIVLSSLGQLRHRLHLLFMKGREWGIWITFWEYCNFF